MKSGITVGYSGVHQAYQIALAAEELHQLDSFYCSLFGAPGKWGGWLKNFVGAEALQTRSLGGLPASKIREIPWPLLTQRARSWLSPGRANDWSLANDWFDRTVSRALRTGDCAIFVGVETCASASLAAARERGMTTALDCPGIDAAFLSRLASQTAAEFGLRAATQADSARMREKKSRELELADLLFVSSEFQALLLKQSGYANKKLQVVPLWADTDFWYPASDFAAPVKGPLRVLYAGKTNLRKGVPYLVHAVAKCAANVRLTLAGSVDRELVPFLRRHDDLLQRVGRCTKIALRRHYQSHDVLVLPSLGDAFGFVAMEAMACGLPVIVTENCGVPVPDPAWRVPIMDADALAARMTIYAQDRELCRAHGQIAAAFSRRFTPQRYRERMKEVFCRLLASPEKIAAANGNILGRPLPHATSA